MDAKAGLGIRRYRNKVNAFEFWSYRRTLPISWRDRVKNEEIL